MSYTTNYAKWQAFKYKDPFAADKFFVVHSRNNLCCRPHCDLGFSFNDNSEIKFIDTISEVINQGYKLCPHCLPNFQTDPESVSEENFVIIDLNLLLSTLKSVNKKVGFIPPLIDNDSPLFFKKALKQVKNKYLKNKLLGFANECKTSKSEKRNLQLKNDFEHLKLIDIACRHIALAAISTTFRVSLYFNSDNNNNNDLEDPEFGFQVTKLNVDDEDVEDFNDDQDQSNNSSESEDTPDYGIINKGSCYIQHQRIQSKKRRGGVLGFKELALKSQLSPWHFHRTFKSMTGITPKQYGDKCFRYLDTKKSQILQSLTCPTAIIMNVRLANPSAVFKLNSKKPTDRLLPQFPPAVDSRDSITSCESMDIYSNSSPLRSTSSVFDTFSEGFNMGPSNNANFGNSYSTINVPTSNEFSYSNIQSSNSEDDQVFNLQTSPLDLEFIKLANNSLNGEYISEIHQQTLMNQIRTNSQLTNNNIDNYNMNDLLSHSNENQNNVNSFTPKISTNPLLNKTHALNDLNVYASGNTTRRASIDISYNSMPVSTSLYPPDNVLINTADPLYFNIEYKYPESIMTDQIILMKQLQLQSFLDKKSEQCFSNPFEDENDMLNWNSMDFKDLMNGYN